MYLFKFFIFSEEHHKFCNSNEFCIIFDIFTQYNFLKLSGHNIINKGPAQKIFKKKFKKPPLLILLSIVRGFLKWIQHVCQTSVRMGIFI